MPVVKIKNLPRLRLADLLRRRKMSLETFIEDSGVQTYEGLAARCDRLGCQPPTLEEYKKLRPDIVNSPQDGIVVVEPFEPPPSPVRSHDGDIKPDVVEPQSGKHIDLKPAVKSKRRKKRKTSPQPQPDVSGHHVSGSSGS